MTTTLTTNPNATLVNCTACNKQATVPFVPTPGRPVYCRDCFAKRGGPMRGPLSRPRGKPAFPHTAVPGARKRMMAQGRKGHFIYDATEVMNGEGGLDDAHVRAFLEMLFARGSRNSTDEAKAFLDEKLEDGSVTADQYTSLNSLVDKYSFKR